MSSKIVQYFSDNERTKKEYPLTPTRAVYDSGGKRLDAILAELPDSPETVVDLKLLGWTVLSEMPVKNSVDDDGVYHQKVDRVALDTLVWQRRDDELFVVTDKLPTAKYPQDNAQRANIYCIKYQTVSRNGLSQDKSIALSQAGSSYLIVNDTSCTDLTAFSAKIAGLYLYYELEAEIQRKVDGNEIHTVFESHIQDSIVHVTEADKARWNAKGSYSKPSEGIPSDDMSSAVQASLSKADTAIQSHQDISGKADKATTLAGYGITDAISSQMRGSANGVAELDATGKIPASQLPSYVDDVIEYTSKSQFPQTGESGKIYVDATTNLTWRWGGTSYVEISPSLALGETSSTAYAGDKGKAAADAISAHIGSTAVHITSAEREAWNAKGSYTKPSTGIPKSDLASAVQTSLGKADTALQSHQDISGKQDKSTAVTHTASTSVGSATQPVYVDANGVATATTYTLGKSVPSNAVFTDTTYSAATTSAAGLMSAADKTKLNGIATGANAYSLPTASASVLGGIKVGSNLSISNGVLSATNTTYSSQAAASGGTTVSLVTTGEKYTWNNKSNLTIGTTATTAAAGNHTHSGYAASSHTHTKSQITDFPTSLPASDVYSWAKASSKPSYAWSEITSKPYSSFGNASQQNASATAGSKSTCAMTDANGYINLNYINSNTSNNENPSVSQVIVTNGSDNYYRKASLAHLKSSLGSMPASDVYSWAKASSKPSYSASEISGLSSASVNYANSAGSLSSPSKSVTINWSNVSKGNSFTVDVSGGYTVMYVSWKKNTGSAWTFCPIPIGGLKSTAQEYAFSDPDGYTCFNLSISGNTVTFYLSRQSNSCYIDYIYLVK